MLSLSFFKVPDLGHPWPRATELPFHLQVTCPSWSFLNTSRRQVHGSLYTTCLGTLHMTDWELLCKSENGHPLSPRARAYSLVYHYIYCETNGFGPRWVWDRGEEVVSVTKAIFISRPPRVLSTQATARPHPKLHKIH